MSAKPEKPKAAKPLLGRKFQPMSGPAKRRAFPRHVAEAELVDSHPVSRSNLRQPSSRSVAGSQRKLSNDLKDDPSDRLNKEEACVDTLTNGYPLSYIDLFYLTHGRFGRYDLRGAELRTMKNHLVDAEKNVRSGEVIPGIHIYHELGNFFEQSERYDAAIYFYHRCQEIAHRHDIHSEESIAYKGLGSSYFEIKDIPQAISMYENGSRIAENYDLQDILIMISISLVQVYQAEADRLEDEKQIDQALDYHQRCFEAAKNAKDPLAQGQSSYRIGLIHLQKEEYEQALEAFNNYLQISTESKKPEEKAHALAKLAQTYQAMGNLTEAIQYLNQLRHEAQESGNTDAEAEATLNLGLIHHKQHNPRKALEFMESHFNLARKQKKNRTMIDAARVNLGMAQANCTFDSYCDLIRENVPALLMWKNKRTKF